jgi:cytidylate kinase
VAAAERLWGDLAMISILTVDREYGSGGPAIAQKLAARLGWTLWDERLTQEIARLAECDLAAVKGREERKDSLYYRLVKSFLRGSFEGNLMAHRLAPLDTDRVHTLAQRVVRHAAETGECVIVGRGSAHFLRDRPDAYHLFIYAPFEEKVRREREAGRDAAQAAELVQTVDGERAAYIKQYFGLEWPCRALYHLMVNSRIGDEAVVRTILDGMNAVETR